MGADVFISYRRGLDSAASGRLRDYLKNQLGGDHVFMDVYSINPGTDFTRKLNAALDECRIFLPVIGLGWLQATDEGGHWRLLDPFDHVRNEILAALERDVVIIPILLEESQMPRPDDLPSAIRRLALHNALSMRHASFDGDAQKIIDAIHVISRGARKGVLPATSRTPLRKAKTDRTGNTSVVLVDDERNILTSLRMAFEAEGFRVRTYSDGLSAFEALTEEPADLGIFDIKMPRMDGLELLRRLRLVSDMPVMFLTSKDEEIDELFGLKMGADDYVAKPFSQRLVIERAKMILSRNQARHQEPIPWWTRLTSYWSIKRERARRGTTAEEFQIVRRGRLKLAPGSCEVYWNEMRVELTLTEFLILQCLASRPGVVKTRDALMDAAFDDQVYVDDRTIDSAVKRIRKKFKAIDEDFDTIETLYGVGYRFKESEGSIGVP